MAVMRTWTFFKVGTEMSIMLLCRNDWLAKFLLQGKLRDFKKQLVVSWSTKGVSKISMQTEFIKTLAGGMDLNRSY